MLASWWKCQITGDDRLQIQFKKGNIVFAKNGEEFITLFDGTRRARLPKSASKNLKILSRLDRNESSSVEVRYQAVQAPDLQATWNAGIVWD